MERHAPASRSEFHEPVLQLFNLRRDAAIDAVVPGEAVHATTQPQVIDKQQVMALVQHEPVRACIRYGNRVRIAAAIFSLQIVRRDCDLVAAPRRPWTPTPEE
jgi:hypothetical protein